jgi:predicted nucleotidyltransferase
MNNIRDDLPNNVKKMVNKINGYLDTQVYFYGSVLRSDYIPGKSDIDMVIFTDNEYSTISKLQHVLHVKRSDFKKVVWKLNDYDIYGYKLKIPDFEPEVEIAIYNNDFKDVIIDEFKAPVERAPLLVIICLYILKFLYYRLSLLSKETYTRVKRYIQNDMMGKVSHFLLLK